MEKKVTVNEMARMVNENAAAHGWWDEERPITELIALIHSEWSEALEEARLGHPLQWKLLAMNDELKYVTPADEEYAALSEKPEGVAVELIDGVIRILDFFGHFGFDTLEPKGGHPMTFESLWLESTSVNEVMPETVGRMIGLLHAYTSEILIEEDSDPKYLVAAMILALTWVYRQGLDPMAVLMEKHEYNKTRPYKHGKAF